VKNDLMVLCFFIASFMLISVLPSIGGLLFDMDVLVQIYREFQTFKKK